MLQAIAPLPVHEHDKEKDNQLTEEWIQETEKRAKPDKTDQIANEQNPEYNSRTSKGDNLSNLLG